MDVGTFSPDEIHIPSVYVDTVVQGDSYEKRIEVYLPFVIYFRMPDFYTEVRQLKKCIFYDSAFSSIYYISLIMYLILLHKTKPIHIDSISANSPIHSILYRSTKQQDVKNMIVTAAATVTLGRPSATFKGSGCYNDINRAQTS